MNYRENEEQSEQQELQRVLDAGRALGAAAVLYHSAIADHFSLGPTDVKVLDLLQRGGPVTPKELGEMTGLAPASITSIADRLEAKQLLARTPHAEDGRRILLGPDPRAFRRMAPLYDDLVASLTEMLSRYTDDQLRLIAEVFEETADRQSAAASRVPPPPQ